MEHTHDFDTRQAHERARFSKTRKAFQSNLRKVNKQENLGLTRPEMEVLQQIATRSSIHLPWAWVQTGTQEEWAEDWAMGTSTLKRVLKGLREKGALLGATAAVEKGLRGKRHKGNLYPVWTISPVLLEIVAGSWSMSHWSVDPKQELKRFQKHFSDTFESETYDPIWHMSVSLSCGTYTPGVSPTPRPGQKPQNPVPARDVVSYQERYDNPPLYVIDVVGSRTCKGSTIGGRLRRRARRSRQALDTHERVIHMTPTLGEDPDKPEPDPRKKSPTTEIADHFRAEWINARTSRTAEGGIWQVGATPWADGSKVAFLSWVKKTFLPDHDNDVDLCKAMITEFCKQPYSYHKASQRAPWRRFAGQQTKMRQKAAQAGHLTSAEQAAREEEQARHARAKAKRRKALKEKQNGNGDERDHRERVTRLSSESERIFFEPDD